MSFLTVNWKALTDLGGYAGVREKGLSRPIRSRRSKLPSLPPPAPPAMRASLPETN
jgi:hypothetical protein